MFGFQNQVPRSMLRAERVSLSVGGLQKSGAMREDGLLSPRLCRPATLTTTAASTTSAAGYEPENARIGSTLHHVSNNMPHSDSTMGPP